MTHTPGPWTFTVEKDGSFGVEIPDGHSVWYGLEGSCQECFGNMHLIAAAPDLLAACENLENDNGAIPHHAWKMVQAAIARARGEA